MIRTLPLRLWCALLGMALCCHCACDTRRFEHDGRTRSYVLHLPSGYDPKDRIPLLLALHGRTGTGSGMARSSGFDALFDEHNFAVAYPNGFQRSWADGRNGSPADKEGIDDVGFIDALIDHVDQEIAVDPRRIYAVGISNGGMMVQRLACELSDRLAGVATIIGSMPENVRQECNPKDDLSVLLMNGTEDPLVPYDGGEVSSDAGGLILSTPDVISFWTQHNDCQGLPDNREIDNEDDATSVNHEHYGNCRGQKVVDLYQVVGGGHTWPGGPQYLPRATIGVVSKELQAAEVIWDFFDQS